MDNSAYDTNDDSARDSEILKAQVVEVLPPSDWTWEEVRPVVPRRRWRVPLLLFIATCVTTTMVGGFSYSIPVMTILVCHEMGHFIQTRRYGVMSSLPFFIPMPIQESLGTLGAVIAMEPRVGHRRALFDIGISGPLAGLVPTMFFLVLGLHYSHIGPPVMGGWEYGDPLLFKFLAAKILGPIPEGFVVYAHPMAFAGWVGLLITSLNLFPIGQLDGGHILYALLRWRAYKVAKFVLFTALFMVILFKLWNWALMLGLLFWMGPTHPPTADDDEPLGFWRYVLGWLTLAFIVIGFTPVPIQPQF